MFRAHDGEVSPVQCSDYTNIQSFGQRDYGSIDRPERQVTVPPHELGDPQPIARLNGHHQKVACREITEEADFSGPAETSLEKVGNLGDDELWDDKWSRVSFEQCETRLVTAIILIDVGIKRP